VTAPWIAAFVALWILVLILGLLVLGTLRRLMPLMERFEAGLSVGATSPSPRGLSPGTVVPPFRAQEIGGAVLTDADLRGSTSIVLFLGSSCRACERFIRDLARGRVPALEARLVPVADETDMARELARSEDTTVLVDEHRALARVFESEATPHAFVVGEDGGVLASGTPNDWNRVRDLLARAQKGGGRTSENAAAPVAS
jgi:hypothetical protein